jgi:hypothetical protein
MIRKSISAEGVLLWWDAHEVSRDGMQAALSVARDFTALLPDFDPIACLSKVCDDIVDAVGIKVRGMPITYRQLRKDVIGVQAVREIKGDKQNEYHFLFSMVARGMDNKNLTVGFAKIDPDGGKKVAEKMRELEQYAQQGWEEYSKFITAKQLTSCLRSLVFHMKGTMLKESGGLYFLPEEHAEAFEKIAGAIEASGSEARFTTGMTDLSMNKRMFQRVMESLESEILAETQQMQDEVAALADGSKRMRKNGIERRLQDICDWTEKVKYYEELMGVAMPKLRGAIGQAKYAIGVHGLEALGASE